MLAEHDKTSTPEVTERSTGQGAIEGQERVNERQNNDTSQNIDTENFDNNELIIRDSVSENAQRPKSNPSTYF